MLVCCVRLLCQCWVKQALALRLRSTAAVLQLLVLQLEPEQALIVFLDLLHGQDLLILELAILALEVSCQSDHFIKLLVSLGLVAAGPDNLLFQYLDLLQIVALLDLEELFLLL